MAERHVLTSGEFERMRAAIQDPSYVARLAADSKSQGLVEVDNPMRREVRPRRGTEPFMDHPFKPGHFDQSRCQVMLARYRCPYPAEAHLPTTEETTSMTEIGKVTHDGATHRAQCLREDCPWTFESTKDGEAGHQLMEHNTEEHAAESERGVADAGFLLTFLMVLGLVMFGAGVVVLVDAVIA